MFRSIASRSATAIAERSAAVVGRGIAIARHSVKLAAPPRLLVVVLGGAAAAAVAAGAGRLAAPVPDVAVVRSAAAASLTTLGQAYRDDVARVVRPAVERTRMLAADPETIAALRAGDAARQTRLCDAAVTRSTEIDAVATFDVGGRIVAVNTVYTDGRSVPPERVDRILRTNFDGRAVVRRCAENGSDELSLEFQTTCDITPALFDSTGLSVACSAPVRDPATGAKVGVVSTRLRFERLTSLRPRDAAVSVEFVTDRGGYFSEAINGGAAPPPVPLAALRGVVGPLVSGDVDDCFARVGTTYLSLFRLKDLAAIDGGGIQVMLMAGEDWLAGEARLARRLEGLGLVVAGLLLAAVAALARGAASLRRSERWNRHLIESALDAVITTDGRGLIRAWNREAVATFGYPPAEAIGRPLADLLFPEALGPEQHERICCPLGAGASAARRRRVEVLAVRRDGARVSVEMVSAPVPTGSGFWFCAFLRDLTEQKATQGRLLQAQKLESIGQLAAGIAHEINTPTQYVGDNTRFVRDGFNGLMALLGLHDRLLGEAEVRRQWPDRCREIDDLRRRADVDFLRDEIPKALEQSISGLDCVTTIVRAMKDFSHPGGEAKEPADLNAAIRSTATVCRSRWKHVAELELDLDPALPDVRVVLGEFNQVVLNLIVNAADAIAAAPPAGHAGSGPGAVPGKICVRTRALDGGRVEVRVVDNGPGIPDAVRHRIFEPFFTTKAVGQGTGQGLTLSRNVVVVKHGGELYFEPAAGGGTAFVVRLPADAIVPGRRAREAA